MSDSLSKEYFVFTWKIKNFSYWQRDYDTIRWSSPFETVKTGNVKWKLELVSNNNYKEFDVHILKERHGDQTFHPMSMTSELSILDEHGQVLESRSVKYANHTEYPLCEKHLAEKSKLEFQNRALYFPSDTLTILCKISHEGIVPGQCSNTLVFYRETIFWIIKQFNDTSTSCKEFQLGSNHFVMVLKRCDSCPPLSRSLRIYQTQGKPVADDFFRILCHNNIEKSFVEILDEYHLDEIDEIELHEDCITNDSLVLKVEYTIGYDILEDQHSPSLPATSQNENIANPTEIDVPEGSLRGDMLRLYKDGKFCDVTLRSAGKSFLVHKNVLCARSPVFCATFEGVTKEARLGVVDIPDVDPDTLDKMLLFLYMDALEDIGLEEASKMYYAADKYAILPLKEKCLSILKTELCSQCMRCSGSSRYTPGQGFDGICERLHL